MLNLWEVFPASQARDAAEWVASITGMPTGVFSDGGGLEHAPNPPLPWLLGAPTTCEPLCGGTPGADCACGRAMAQAAHVALERGEAVCTDGPFGAESIWASPLLASMEGAEPLRAALVAVIPQSAHLPLPEQLAHNLGVVEEVAVAISSRALQQCLTTQQTAAVREATRALCQELASDITALGEAVRAHSQVVATRSLPSFAARRTSAGDLDALGDVLADWTSASDIMARAVALLAEGEGCLAIRAWITRAADRCRNCSWRTVCGDAVTCLHSVATSSPGGPDEWDRLPRADIPADLLQGGTSLVTRSRPASADGPVWAWVARSRARVGACLCLGPPDEPLGILTLAYRTNLPAGVARQLPPLGRNLALALSAANVVESERRRIRSLRALGEELSAQNRQLQESARAREMLISSMSHELRTPLNAIVGFTELLRDGVAGEVNERQASYLHTVEEAAGQLVRLVDDLITVSTIDAGGFVLRPAPCRVAGVLAEALQIVSLMAPGRNVTVATDLPPDDTVVVLDAGRLREVVVSLLGHALRASPKGETVLLSARADGGGFTVRVRSQGHGGRPEEADPIAETLAGESESENGYSRAGLSLRVARRLVELHGGRVEVRSVEGGGSETMACFPPPAVGAAPPAADGLPEATLLGASGPGLCALVVEADEASRRLLCEVAAAADLQAVPVVRAAELPAAVQALRPNLVIIGQALGGAELGEAFWALRQGAPCPEVPVLLVADHELAEKAMQAGVTDTACYPVDREALARKIRRLVAPRTSRPPRVVLVADDNPTFTDALASLLQANGMSWLGARDGEEALELTRRHHPDIILLDIMMPRLNGWRVLEALREDDRTRGIPVVVMTGKPLTDGERDVLAGLSAGVVSKTDFDKAAFWDLIDGLHTSGGREG